MSSGVSLSLIMGSVMAFIQVLALGRCPSDSPNLMEGGMTNPKKGSCSLPVANFKIFSRVMLPFNRLPPETQSISSMQAKHMHIN